MNNLPEPEGIRLQLRPSESQIVRALAQADEPTIRAMREHYQRPDFNEEPKQRFRDWLKDALDLFFECDSWDLSGVNLPPLDFRTYTHKQLGEAGVFGIYQNAPGFELNQRCREFAEAIHIGTSMATAGRLLIAESPDSP